MPNRPKDIEFYQLIIGNVNTSLPIQRSINLTTYLGIYVVVLICGFTDKHFSLALFWINLKINQTA
jgi:hypothetical protein